jgi:CHAT domain-containing protein/tetratricopeptide (TPR) repeat protein
MNRGKRSRRLLVISCTSLLAVPLGSIFAATWADDPPKAPALTVAQRERLKERDREEAIASMERLAVLHEARDDWPTASSICARVLSLRTEALGERHWKAVDARFALERTRAIGRLDLAGRRRFVRDVGQSYQQYTILNSRGNYAEAMGPVREALSIQREVLGERHPNTITSLSRLGKLLLDQENLAEARPLLERVLRLRQEVLGERHPDTIGSLSSVGMLLAREGKLDAARPELERALRLYEEELGETHPYAMTSMDNLAQLLLEREQFDAARPLFERELRLRQVVQGERHPDTIRCLDHLASLLHNKGDLDAARPLFERALRLRQEVLGERHPDAITSLNNLARLSQDRGDMESCGEMLERALRLRQEVLGERHPDTIQSLNNLALLLQVRGDLNAARPLYERALRLSLETLGERHALSLTSLSNLATLLHDLGDLDAAQPMYERVLRLRWEVMGERHHLTINSIVNLADLAMARGDLDVARPQLERALRLDQEVLGERHPSTIRCLNNLAALLQNQGQFDAALPMHERALRLSEETLGERHELSITCRNNLGSLLHARGDLKAARPIYERSLGLQQEVLGDRHRDTIQGFINLATLLRDLGDVEAAKELASRALDASRARLVSSLPSLTGREQLALLSRMSASLNLMLALPSPRPMEDSRAYADLLGFKGLVAEADTARRVADRPEARALRLRLSPLRVRLNALAYARVPADQADEHARAVRSTADEVAAVELALARAVDWRPRTVEAARIAAAFLPGACLVDFFRSTYIPAPEPGRPTPPSQSRYVAFVVRAGGEPTRVELGRADVIDEALASWRARLQRGGEADDLGRAVAQLVWKPLESRLGDARSVLISPDGDLAFLPWAALPDGESGSYLLRRFAFAVVPSARQLAALAEREPRPAPGGLLAVGGVDYTRGEPGELVPVAGASRSAALNRSALIFEPLPGTDAEVRSVATLFRATHPDGPAVDAPTGARATKARLAAAMPGRRYLHLATHGYFAPPGFKNALIPEDDRTGLKVGEGMGRTEVTGFYPGLLSGLAWAGAASPEANPSTGVLDVGAGLMTAEEVSGLGLEGSELAVLSACETGLGRTAGSEGVLGLQRAFLQAGCRTVVASLWRVEDDATRELMTRFYKNLWEKKLPPLEALRHAQLSILDDQNFGDGGNPRLWAAWMLGGDPGGLPKLDPPADALPEPKK